MNVFLQCVGYLGLVLLPLTTVLAMPVLRPVAWWLVLATIVGLPPSTISTVNVEVLLRGLSAHFVCSMLRLGC